MELKALARDVYGKKTKAHRKSGTIPAVIYASHIKEPISIFFDKVEFLKIYQQAWRSTPVTITGKGIKELVLIHDITVHPVTSMLMHVDFLGVQADQEVEAEVEIIFEGTSAVEKDKLGRIEEILDYITVKAIPSKLPKSISVDVSTIETLQDVIFIKDLDIPKDVEVMHDEDQAVATAVEFKEEIIEEEETSEDEEAEGDEEAPESTDAE